MNRDLVERELTSRRAAPARRRARRRRRSVTVNLAESPLTWLHARGHLDDRQLDAGERLRADWERAQLAPAMTMRWDAVRIGGSGDGGLSPSERQIAAKARFDGAVAAAGRGWRTCCGASSAPARACRSRKRRSPGRCAAASWCCGSRSTGWRSSTGSGDEPLPTGFSHGTCPFGARGGKNDQTAMARGHASLAVTPLLLASPGHAQPNQPILAAVQACGPGSRALLEQVASTAAQATQRDSKGRRDLAGKLRELGAEYASPDPARRRRQCRRDLTGAGKGRILLIAHMDTVFSRGEVPARAAMGRGSLRRTRRRRRQGGGVTAICALSALKAIGYRDFARIDLLLNASEETGSFGSRDLIRAMAARRRRHQPRARRADRQVDGEPQGIGDADVRVHRPRRALGPRTEKGRNAVLEAARVALELGKLADPARRPRSTSRC